MESRAFIREAATVMREIDNYELARNMGVAPVDPNTGVELRKRVTSLLAQLQNPTLPSAYKLRDKAIEVGIPVDQKVLHRLHIHEFL